MNTFNFRRKAININMLFSGHYVDARALYVQQNSLIPCICYIGEINCDHAFAFIKDQFKTEVKYVYQHYFYDHEKKGKFFNNCVFVLKQNRMIEVHQNFCHVLHCANDYEWAEAVVNDLAQFRMEQIAPLQTRIVGFAKHTEMN